MRIVTHSEISTLFRCPRAHELSYIKMLTTRRPVEYLTESSACHDALEVFYKGGPVEEALARYDEIFDVARAKLGDGFLRAHEIRFLRMRALVLAYFDHYACNDARDWEFEETEFEFSLPVRNPDNLDEILPDVTFCGKMDGIWRQRSGRRIRHLVEHKFLGQFNPDKNTLSIDQQVSLYSLAAMETLGLSHPVILYNVAKKPTNVMRETEEPMDFLHRVHKSILQKPEKFFHRLPLYRDHGWIAEARRILWVGANMIVNGEPRYKFRNVGLHCNQLCRFLDICYDENPSTVNFLYEKKRKAHSELKISEAAPE